MTARSTEADDREPDSETLDQEDLIYPRVGLYVFAVDQSSYIRVNDGPLEYAPINGVEDAFAIRDASNPDLPSLRFPGHELRKLGVRI